MNQDPPPTAIAVRAHTVGHLFSSFDPSPFREKDRAAREAVRQQEPRLFAEIAATMFRHDLMGLNFETNPDEYEPEAGTVIPRLGERSSARDVAAVLHEEFSTWFGADIAGPQAKYSALAEEVWALWQSNQTRSGPPSG
jgi:hypothetical protein